ncbi:MAG TPA: UbiX family flavin prenyltransferase [Thiothrix sp.]|nr:UbiX family flavin prenyltransferase [Thiothrix sp.]
MSRKTVTLIMTGASGAEYGLRLLEELVNANAKIYLLLSRPAQIVIKMETPLNLPARAKDMQVFFTELYDADEGQIQVFEREQWMAPIASGSGVADVTIVCPCTTGTLSAIAMGSSKNLLERACDVAIKEAKSLILVVRETPFSTIHLENMLKLSQMGVTIMPANPGFYHQPDTLDDIIDFMVAKILDHVGFEHELLARWGGGGVFR